MSGSRPLKRQRIYRACDQCRRRKSKCDGEQPVCSICHQANRACTYETGGGRRGLPSGYVRSLEIALGLILRHAPNSQNTLNNALRDSRGQGNFLTSKSAKQSVSTWRKSKSYRDISQILSPGSEDDPLDDSEWEPVESRDQDEAMVDPDTTASNQKPDKVETIQQLPDNASQSHSLMNARLPDDTSDLVDFYFTYTHCWFPILERRSVLRAMHLGNGSSGVRNFYSNEGRDSSSRIVLWSLVAYTSAMRGTCPPEAPNLFSLQLAIEQQALTEWEALDLGHIQAILILVLMHISMGHMGQAWAMVGKVARMLATLSLPARTARFNHTFHACVLLDNMLSALFGRAPCFSKEEQLMYGPIEEDDLEEWDVWTPSRSGMDGQQQTVPATPLRALSTFNQVQQLVQQLSGILYQPLDLPCTEEILKSLRIKQNIISRSHPYDRRNHATPSLLNLHLVSAFTTLSFCRKFEPVSSVAKDLCIPSIHHILDLLSHYREITGTMGSSPLTICFALQCQRSLGIANISDPETLENRISAFLCPLKPLGFPEWKLHISHSALPILSTEQCEPPENQGNSLSQSIPALPDLSNIPTIAISQQFEQAEPSSVVNLSAIPPSSELSLQSLGGPDDADMYDALFEEMVTSFPTSRQEPSFAQNLGFYDGDLDTDFLAQLQQPPA